MLYVFMQGDEGLQGSLGIPGVPVRNNFSYFFVNIILKRKMQK